MPLPCSPVSNSIASSEAPSSTTEEESDDSLTTPRPGPSDPAQRTVGILSKPLIPTSTSSTDKPSRGEPSSAVGTARKNVKSSLYEVVERASKERQRSVAFLPDTDTALPKRNSSCSTQISSIMASTAANSGAESSADENTAMFSKGTAWGQGLAVNGYGAVGEVTQQDNGDDIRQDPWPRENSTAKRRKSGSTLRSKHSFRNAANASSASGITTTTQQQRVEEDEHGDSWWKTLLDKYGSVELENKGSVARDHLALERTFLAWLRTSLSFASIGIAVTQLFRLNTSIASDSGPSATAKLRSVGKPLGATFLGISILILLLGFHRYFESQHYVIRGKFPASRGTIVIVSAVATALIVASLVVVIAVAPEAFER